MGIFGVKTQKFLKAKPKKAEKPSIFGERESISRKEFERELRKASPQIPGGGGMYTRRQREQLAEKFWPAHRRYHLSKGDFKKRIELLRRERFRTQTGAERLRIDREIRYLQNLGGRL